jgi:VNT family MFS transporter (synaptic vesicle glycoprotein 2)
LGEFCSDRRRSKELTFAGVFNAFALVFCPGLMWLMFVVPSEVSLAFVPMWRCFLFICATLSLIVFGLLAFLPESPKFLLGKKIITLKYDFKKLKRNF